VFNTELGKFCSEHASWEALLEAEPYCLKIKKDANYIMFSYDQIRSNFNIPLVREARGIIFKIGNWETPVCWAFNKFGNYGESYVPEIDWDHAFVTEKVDGSLIKLWHDAGDWHISTNGTIDAFKANMSDMMYSSFGEYFYATACNYYGVFDDFLRGLNKDLTYMFELVGPYNRVVIPYEKCSIYFLGARNNLTGIEYLCTSTNVEHLGVDRFNRPQVYPLTTLDACIRMSETFSWDQEGFVGWDSSFNRVKVKSPAYVIAHFARNNNVITKKHLIRVILLNEVDEFICYAEEYKDKLEEIQKQINLFVNLGNKLAEACREISSALSRPDYARLVKAMPEFYQGLLFCNYDAVKTMADYTAKWNENKWEEYLELFEQYKIRNWECKNYVS
jgi:T4 RnlA family RNA ligase